MQHIFLLTFIFGNKDFTFFFLRQACPEKCDNHVTCVLCQAFDKGSAEDCAGCNLNIRFVNTTEPNCIHNDDGCLTVFNFEENFGTGNETVLVVKERSMYILLSY